MSHRHAAPQPPRRKRWHSDALDEARRRTNDALGATTHAQRLVGASIAVVLLASVPALAAAQAPEGNEAIQAAAAIEDTAARSAATPSNAFTAITAAADASARERRAAAQRADRDRRNTLERERIQRAESNRKARAERNAQERRAKAERAARLAREWATPTVSGRYGARFGQRGPLWSTGSHTGADFDGNTGDTIRAVHSGVVVFAGSDGPYGNHVQVRHNDGSEAWYAHLSSISVKVGQKVTTRQRLGAMGSTGNSTGSHLHLEIHPSAGSGPVDPIAFLRGKGVKL